MRRPILGLVVTLVLLAGISGCSKKQPAVPPPAPTPAPQSAPPPEPQPEPPPAPRRKPPTPKPVPAAPPVEAPRLGAMLTPEQQRDQNALIDRALADAATSLSAVEKHPLSSAQQAAIMQIRGFMAQAQELRKTDLPGARSLAGRAQLLANDLLKTFH